MTLPLTDQSSVLAEKNLSPISATTSPAASASSDEITEARRSGSVTVRASFAFGGGDFAAGWQNAAMRLPSAATATNPSFAVSRHTLMRFCLVVSREAAWSTDMIARRSTFASMQNFCDSPLPLSTTGHSSGFIA